MSNQKLNKSYLIETIVEVMSEIGENFGATPAGEFLYEAWDSQWPEHFWQLKTSIHDLTIKEQKAPKEILAKYAIEAMSFTFLKPAMGEFDEERAIWDAYKSMLGSFETMYVRDEGDKAKIENFIFKIFNEQTKNNWVQKFFDARRDKGNEAALRVLNKMISSLNKQIFGKPKEEGKLAGIFGELEDEGIDWKSVRDEFDKEITGVLQGMQFKEMSLIQNKIHKIIKFVNLDKRDDNAKKLEAYYNNIKAAANSDEIDVLAIANNVQIIQITNSWIEEQMYTINMTPCSDLDADHDEPCVLHKFDDGFFWYDIKADSCEISAEKMNSCGDASMSGSELYNLMSHSETGKPRWHVMVEWNQEEKAIIQVLGNSNQVPKTEYWPYIKWFYEKFGKPEISNYAWEHVSGNNVKQNVYDFLKYLGLKSAEPLTEEWVQMKQQISDGFYNVQSYEGDLDTLGHREGDFSRLRFIVHADRIDMTMRIKRNLLKVGSQKGAAEWEDIRDYKNAARRLQRTEVLADDYILDMIPGEWEDFFKTDGWTQRVRFSNGGNMMLYFNWVTKTLQDPSGGNYRDEEWFLELQRQGLARFMQEMKQNFSVEAMTKLGKDFGNHLESVADEITMDRVDRDRDDDLNEGSGKMKKLDANYLKFLILETLKENKEKDNILSLLNHSNPEFQLQGIQLADLIYPELVDQADSLPEVHRLSQPADAERFMEIIKSRVQEFSDVWIREKFKYVKDRQPDAAVQLKKVIADNSPLWTDARLDRWSSDYNKKTMMEILNSIDYSGDGHDIWLSSEAIDVVVDQFDKIDIDISFELELKWSFKIYDELTRYFKNREEALIFEKAKALSKMIRETA